MIPYSTTQKHRSADPWSMAVGLFNFIFGTLYEVWLGYRTNSTPLILSIGFGLTSWFVVFFGLDGFIWSHYGLEALRFGSNFFTKAYAIISLFSGVFLWAMFQLAMRNRLCNRLKASFDAAGLISKAGKYPRFVFDRPIDVESRRLRLQKAGMPATRFFEAKKDLESSLRVFIDEIKDDISFGTIDITYSYKPLPSFIASTRLHELGPDNLIVGKSKSSWLCTSLKKTPHVLIAGQTGGGKSTALRQMITGLYLNNPDYQFCLIDLKRGLEFQTFEDLPRISLATNVDEAHIKLDELKADLEFRLSLISKNKSKDIDALRLKKKIEFPDGVDETSLRFDRKVIVIDEIAELFLSGGASNGAQSQRAKAVIGQITRIGRAAGMSVIAATQRPDVKTIDGQIKTNLPGKLCFQMPDLASSLVVLNSKRAADLPPISGRAVWQNGLETTEVQVPFLSEAEASELLLPFKEERQPVGPSSPVSPFKIERT